MRAHSNPAFKINNEGAVQITPSGKFLYITNESEGTTYEFALDSSTGAGGSDRSLGTISVRC